MQFIRGATVFFLNNSLSTSIPSTLATSGLIINKGNKTALYLHWTDAFLSVMRETLAGETLQIIYKSPMDIYYSPTINYMCLENLLIEVDICIHVIVKVNEQDIKQN